MRVALRLVAMWLLLPGVCVAGPGDLEAREARLRDLGDALAAYAFEHDGQLPARLSELYYQGYLSDLAAFAGETNDAPLAFPSDIDERAAYELVAHTLDPAAAEPILRERAVETGTDSPLILY